jgi:hypothetical protein
MPELNLKNYRFRNYDLNLHYETLFGDNHNRPSN